MSVYKNFSDEELTALLKKGNELAFTEIYNRYWAEMYYHAHRILKDEDTSKDVIQDVFSNLWLKSPMLNVNIKLSGHLYIAVRNKVFNLVAHNKVRSDYLTSIAVFFTEYTPDVNLYEERELLAHVEAEISNLPAKMRQIFELSRKDNLSHKEIAIKLNLSEQTVKKQVQNALKIMKPRLRLMKGGIFILLFFR
ncbi:RNA polymerase sigma factor [Pedobacter sp.]|uniref:RNA polymerase sigma factor n=1 Tax=Pedobacter sp. TaxID=1411316 RepID=UPI003D7FB597